MAGRNDFSIIRARLLADDRAHRAAELYVEAGIALEATALATVVGHVAEIGLWASRETDDGVLPGDGVTTVAVATLSLRSVAQTIVTALTACDLLREREIGVYVVGFNDCYWPAIRKRAKDAERKAKRRAEQRDDAPSSDLEPEQSGVRRTSAGHPADVQAPSERYPNAPNPNPSPTPHPRPNPNSPPKPFPAGEGSGGDFASPSGKDAAGDLTVGQRAAAMVVAEAIASGHVRLEPDEGAQRLDREIAAARAAVRLAKRKRDGNAVAAAERSVSELERRRNEAERARRADAIALLRAGDPGCRPLLERWQNSDVLCGKEKHRVPLRVACKVARDQARHDARDARREPKSKRPGGNGRAA